MSLDAFDARYDVRSFFVTPTKHLGLVSTLNVLQDVAWRHAEAQGHGWEDSVRRGALWVMTRQALRLTDRAHLGETVDVRTWLRPPAGAFVTRDFTLTVTGRPLGTCAMTFMLIDSTTRRPVRGPVDFAGVTFREHGALSLQPGKISPRDDAREFERFRVRNSDLDVNDHVNNTRYAQWILDAVPLDWHRRFTLRSYDICFLAEAKSGDEVSIRLAEVDGGAVVHGVRLADQRVIFAAQVGVA